MSDWAAVEDVLARPARHRGGTHRYGLLVQTGFDSSPLPNCGDAHYYTFKRYLSGLQFHAFFFCQPGGAKPLFDRSPARHEAAMNLTEKLIADLLGPLRKNQLSESFRFAHVVIIAKSDGRRLWQRSGAEFQTTTLLQEGSQMSVLVYFSKTRAFNEEICRQIRNSMKRLDA